MQRYRRCSLIFRSLLRRQCTFWVFLRRIYKSSDNSPTQFWTQVQLHNLSRKMDVSMLEKCHKIMPGLHKKDSNCKFLILVKRLAVLAKKEMPIVKTMIIRWVRRIVAARRTRTNQGWIPIRIKKIERTLIRPSKSIMQFIMLRELHKRRRGTIRRVRIEAHGVRENRQVQGPTGIKWAMALTLIRIMWIIKEQ